MMYLLLHSGTWNPVTLLVTLLSSWVKRATSVNSLNAIAFSARIPFWLMFIGPGPFGRSPWARCSIVLSCSLVGLGRPSGSWEMTPAEPNASMPVRVAEIKPRRIVMGCVRDRGQSHDIDRDLTHDMVEWEHRELG